MTTRDRFDIDGAEGIEPENAPHPEFTDPDDWHARPSAGAYLSGSVLLAVLVIAACFWVAIQGRPW